MSTSAPNEALRLEPIARLEDVQEEWSRLAAAAGHPFASWEWNARWWEIFGGGHDLHSFICRDSTGTAVAILPLYMAVGRPIRIARFLGDGPWQSPVCAPDHRGLAAEALWDVTRRGAKGCRLVLAERLPNEQGWDRLVRGRLIAKHNDIVLRFDGMSWEDFLASKSRKFREVVGPRERRLVREHGLAYRLADDPERLSADMDILMRLHAERWGARSVGVFRGASAEFHRRFAADALERGWLRLWFAELRGEPVAAWYCWRFGGSEWLYQSGRDPRFDRLSVGFTLLAHVVREACRDGVDAYHFLYGRDEYKTRFTEDDPGSVSCLVGPDRLAHAGELAIRAMTTRVPAARRFVSRHLARRRDDWESGAPPPAP